MTRIPVHIINVASRVDRRTHILAEFGKHPEFEPILVNAVTHESAATSLWLTIKTIVAKGQNSAADYIIVCEDDHCFTAHYHCQLLTRAIADARHAGADILFGGVSWFSNAIALNQHLFWVEKSSGLQFTVIFKKFYSALLETAFGPSNAADTVISSLSERKYFIHPFISVQKEFGYSDITPKNNIPGRVDALFGQSMAKSNAINMLYDAYRSNGNGFRQAAHDADTGDFSVLTMVSGDVDKAAFAGMESKWAACFRLQHLEKVASDAANKDLVYLRQAVDRAMQQEEELFVYINAAASLSANFSETSFYKCIRQAYQNGGDLLLGGVDDFDFAVPVSDHLFWINNFISSPLMVFFKPCYKKIRKATAGRAGIGLPTVSSISVKKIAVFPFVVAGQAREAFFANEANYRLSRVSDKMPAERLWKVLEIVNGFGQSDKSKHV